MLRNWSYLFWRKAFPARVSVKLNADFGGKHVNYCFGPHTLDTELIELRRNGELIPVEPQVFRLLVYLIENRNKVVSKDDLIEAIWDGRIISDASITSRLNLLRQAVGDTEREKKVIRTFPKRGFRFIQDVQEQVTETAPSDTLPVPKQDTSDQSGTAAVQSPVPEFRELRPVSLVAVLPDFPDDDPEEYDALRKRLRQEIKDSLSLTGGLLMDSTGGAEICVFGASAPSEVFAADALLFVRHFGSLTDNNRLRLAVVTGDLILDPVTSFSSRDVSLVAHLTQRAEKMARQAEAGETSIEDSVSGHVPRAKQSDLPDTSLPSQDQKEPDEPAFLGREFELGQITEDLLGVLAGNGGRAISLVGEAGIGKSSLIQQVLRLKPTQAFSVLFLEGFERTSNKPFAPMFSLIGQWVQNRHLRLLDQSNDTEESKGIPERHLPAMRYFLDEPDEDGEWTGLEPVVRRKRIADLLRHVVAESSAEAPLLLVVEDLHWLDEETVTLLELLVDELPAENVMMLATYRPNHTNKWQSRSYARLLQLRPLNQTESEKLLDRLLSPLLLPVQTKRLLFERTAGIPYFLAELAKDRHPQAQTTDVSNHTSEWLADDLPPTVRDVLSARIQKLGMRERWVLQCAAILGMQTADATLSKLTGLSDDDLEDSLGQLRAEEMLIRSRGGMSKRHSFRHALLFDATYASILRSQKRKMHRQALEILNTDAHQNEAKAIDLAPHALMSEDWETAGSLYTRAGDSFAEISAYSAAQNAYVMAIKALRNLPRTRATSEAIVDIRLRLRPVLVPLGQYDSAVEHLEKAHLSLVDQQNTGLLARTLIGKSYLFSTHGRLDRARAAAMEARLIPGVGEQGNMEARLALGQALSMLCEWRSALDEMESTVPFWKANPLERFGHTGTRSVWCFGHMARCHALSGNYEGSEALALKALELALQTGRPVDITFAQHRLAEALMPQQKTGRAKALLKEALALADRSELPIFSTWIACDLAPVELSDHGPDLAGSFIEKHLAAARRLKLRQFEAWLVLRHSEVSAVRKDVDSALKYALEADDIARTVGDPKLQILTLKQIGTLKSQRGEDQDELLRSADIADRYGIRT